MKNNDYIRAWDNENKRWIYFHRFWLLQKQAESCLLMSMFTILTAIQRIITFPIWKLYQSLNTWLCTSLGKEQALKDVLLMTVAIATMQKNFAENIIGLPMMKNGMRVDTVKLGADQG